MRNFKELVKRAEEWVKFDFPYFSADEYDPEGVMEEAREMVPYAIKCLVKYYTDILQAKTEDEEPDPETMELLEKAAKILEKEELDPTEALEVANKIFDKITELDPEFDNFSFGDTEGWPDPYTSSIIYTFVWQADYPEAIDPYNLLLVYVFDLTTKE